VTMWSRMNSENSWISVFFLPPRFLDAMREV
jgi:hypothetical protein